VAKTFFLSVLCVLCGEIKTPLLPNRNLHQPAASRCEAQALGDLLQRSPVLPGRKGPRLRIKRRNQSASIVSETLHIVNTFADT
jgi:hypothetical protein